MEVRRRAVPALVVLGLTTPPLSRPKEHTVFHVLAFVKIAFSTDGLSKFKEADCANKEAFKYVPPSVC